MLTNRLSQSDLPTLDEVGAFASEKTRASDPTAPNAAAFAQMLDQIRLPNAEPLRTKAPEAAAATGGLSLGFAASGAGNTRVQASLSAPGARGEAMHDAAIHGHKTNETKREPSEWERTKAQREDAERGVLGAGQTDAKLRAKDERAEEVIQGKLNRAGLAAKGIGLDGRGETQRADGSTLLRDEQGTAHVAGAKNPELDLASYIKSEAKSLTEDGTLDRLAAKAAKQKPQREADRFMEQSEGLRAKAPEKLATMAENQRAENDLRVADESEARKEANSSPRDTVGERKTAEAEKGVRGASGRETRGETGDKQGEGGKESQSQTTAWTETAAKSESARAMQARSGKPLAPFASALGQVATLEATPVAQALQKGDAPMAAGKLAQLLGARIEALIKGGERGLTLTLNPRELGEISAQLLTRGEKTDVHLKAEKDAVGRTLENAVPELQRLLNKAGVQVGQITIEYGLADFGQQTQGQFAQSQQDGAADFAQEAQGVGTDAKGGATTAPLAGHDGVLHVVA